MSVARACVCCGTACGWIDTVTSARRYLSQRAGLVGSRRRDSAPVISRPVINVGRRARSELHHRVTPDPTHPPTSHRTCARARPHGPSGVQDACVWMHARRRRGESTGQVKAAGKLRVNSSSGGFTLAKCSPAAPRVCQQPTAVLFIYPPVIPTGPVVCVRACRSQARDYSVGFDNFKRACKM